MRKGAGDRLLYTSLTKPYTSCPFPYLLSTFVDHQAWIDELGTPFKRVLSRLLFTSTGKGFSGKFREMLKDLPTSYLICQTYGRGLLTCEIIFSMQYCFSLLVVSSCSKHPWRVLSGFVVSSAKSPGGVEAYLDW
jgi:hypothetical protein